MTWLARGVARVKRFRYLCSSEDDGGGGGGGGGVGGDNNDDDYNQTCQIRTMLLQLCVT